MYFDCKRTICSNQYAIPKIIKSLLLCSINLVPIQHKLCNIFILGKVCAIFISVSHMKMKNLNAKQCTDAMELIKVSKCDKRN